MTDTTATHGQQVEEYFAHFLDHATAPPTSELLEMSQVITERCVDSGTLYVFGNGACAALAAHMATDLGKGTATDLVGHTRPATGRRLRIVSLADNTALLTAYGNDLDFTAVFAQQLRNLLRRADSVLALSASGASPNVLAALDYATEVGAYRMGMTGSGPAAQALVDRTDLSLQAPSAAIDQIEDWHVMYNHVLTRLVRAHMNKTSAG
jgi:D-sedoheptulose 7-phosphate isomerase